MTSKHRAISDPAATSLRTWPVSAAPRSPLVLIVDEDLGFVWWLSQIFNEAGCQVVPALNLRESASITRELDLNIDMLVVDPELTGVSEMIESLSRSRSPKIVAIRDHDNLENGGIYAHATLERPSGWDPISQQHWLGCVNRLVKDVQIPRLECPEFS